jgi:hypothetical protein
MYDLAIDLEGEVGELFWGRLDCKRIFSCIETVQSTGRSNDERRIGPLCRGGSCNGFGFNTFKSLNLESCSSLRKDDFGILPLHVANLEGCDLLVVMSNVCHGALVACNHADVE